jgi:catechol 2,3-dioxygenase-like lactoylglutathione lyase family enzyme
MSSEGQSDTKAAQGVVIDHVAILVRDLDSAVSYFKETFGLEVASEEVLPGSGMKAAYLGAAGGALLQLIEPPPGSPFADQLQDGAGIHHICIKTDSIQGVLNRMDEDGRPIVPGGRGMKVCFPEHHPYGVTVELAE